MQGPQKKYLLRIMKVVVRGHVIYIGLLVFHLEVEILIAKICSSYNLSALRMQHLRLQVALKFNHSGHNEQSSYQTLQSIRHGSLGYSSHSGLVGVVPQSISEVSFGCGKIGHQTSKFSRCELIIQNGSMYVSRQHRDPRVCFDWKKDSQSTRECP